MKFPYREIWDFLTFPRYYNMNTNYLQYNQNNNPYYDNEQKLGLCFPIDVNIENLNGLIFLDIFDTTIISDKRPMTYKVAFEANHNGFLLLIEEQTLIRYCRDKYFLSKTNTFKVPYKSFSGRTLSFVAHGTEEPFQTIDIAPHNQKFKKIFKVEANTRKCLLFCYKNTINFDEICNNLDELNSDKTEPLTYDIEIIRHA